MARNPGRAGKQHGLRARIGNQSRANLSVSWKKLQDIARHARFVQEPDGLRRDQRCLLGGLGKDRVSGRERSRNLTGENRQRKVPGADADRWA